MHISINCLDPGTFWLPGMVRIAITSGVIIPGFPIADEVGFLELRMSTDSTQPPMISRNINGSAILIVCNDDHGRFSEGQILEGDVNATSTPGNFFLTNVKTALPS